MLSDHEPVMLNEVLAFLDPQKDQTFIDCTLGGGGHSKAILDRIAPAGRLLAFDWDGTAVERTVKKLAEYSKRTIIVNQSYTDIKEVAYANGFNKVNGILLDLGLSLDQLKNSGRGFSFQLDEPLDMRFSTDNGVTAADILNKYRASELEKIFFEYGEESQTRRIVKAIVEYRKEKPILTTLQLVTIVVETKTNNPRVRIHPATQVFQALRIAVNKELENVQKVLNDSLELLAPGGKIAVISFHSLEDRIVKSFFKLNTKKCICPPELPECRCEHEATLKIITKKPISPSQDEIDKNFRARSAKLRVAERI